MPGTPTTKYAIPTLAGTDLARDIDTNVNSALTSIDGKMVGYSAGLLAVRPTSTGGSPGVAGRRYRATDTGQEFIDTGTSWVEVAQAPVADASLTSPNNSVWRPVFEVGGVGLAAGTVAGTYIMGNGLGPLSTGSAYLAPLWHPISADLAVAGKTTQVRVRAAISVNATAPAVTATVGLYPISAVAGASSSAMTYTLGSVVASVAFATPSASTTVRAAGTAVTLPSLASYVFAVVVSGTVATNSLTSISAALEMRHN